MRYIFPMLGGGIADKVGNEYELRWSLVETLRVLRGLADEIRLEPFNEDANGLEFRITNSSVDEWHQCKRQRTSGSWTLRALTTEGVLAAFARKLQSRAACVFVSSDPAPDFEKLIAKAQIAETAADFYGPGGIGKSDAKALRDLTAAWQVDTETQFAWLKRCRVEVVSASSLLKQLQTICDLLFKTPADTAIDRLLRFLTNNLAQRLTTARLRTEIAELGIEWRSQLDETLDARFVTATDEYLGTLSTNIAGLQLTTEMLHKVVSTAIDGSRSITLVAGAAGSGKSVVLARIIAEARQRGWPVLALRIDRFLTINTLQELGSAMLDLAENPVGAFGNRMAELPTLLVIDQVDAVSEASGRSSRMRELLFRMIDQTASYPNMRVVAACRAYDLQGDTNLQNLSASERVSSLQLEPLGWDAGVLPVLHHLSGDPERFSERERQLLSTPINLRLLADIVQAGDGIAGELTSTRLFDKLMEVRGRELRQTGFTWTPEAALGAIAQSMSDNQDLTTSSAVLDAFQGAIDALASHGLITASGGKLQFAHESYFDQSFSRRFVSGGQSLYAVLISAEQRLFRRTQVRQIFTRLRDSAERAYLQNLREVMEADDVRYLVKDAVAYWLSDVTAPTAAERSLVEGWFEVGHPLERLARIVFNGRDWLTRLIDSGSLLRWVDQGAEKKDFAFWVLGKGAVSHSNVVAGFMNAWWNRDQVGHAPEMMAWFERLYPDGPIGAVEVLYADVITTLPPAAIKENFFENFQLGTWVHKSPGLGARILGLWLKKWMVVFPEQHPFAQVRSGNETHWIGELAKEQPEALLEATSQTLADALERERAAIAGGTLRYPTIRPPHYKHDQEFVRGIIAAVEAVAESAPAKAESFLQVLGDQTEVALFIRLRAIAKNGAALGHLLAPLLAHPKVFKIGDGDGDWQPFAQATAAAMPHLLLLDREVIEVAILSYRPEYDWARRYAQLEKIGELVMRAPDTRRYLLHQLNLSGRDERAILSTIGVANLSATARHRLAELDRKFAGQPLPEARGTRGGYVRSPIEATKAQRMSDEQWLSAIRKYQDDERHVYEHDGVIGGASQLSSVLQAQTKEEPQRFVALLEKWPTDINPAYAEAIVNGLHDSDTDAAWVARAVKAARRWPDHDFDRSVSWTVQRHQEAGADPDVLGMVLYSAEFGKASDTAVRTTNKEEKKIQSVDELLQEDNDLYSSGINCERGSAYEALANIVWDQGQTLPAILALLDRQVDAEPLTSVRMCMAHTINSVGKYDTAKAVSLLKRLVAKDLRVLQSPSARHLLNWAVHDHADVVADFVDDLLQSESESLRAFGHLLESLLALLDDDQNIAFLAGFTGNELRRRVAAYRAAGNVGSDRHGPRSASWLLPLFSDENAEVRRETAHIDWTSIIDGDTDPTVFAKAYLSSAAFAESSDQLMRALEKSASQWPDLTFDAVDRVLTLSGGWTGDQRRGHYSTMHHLSRVLIELYRSAPGGSVREKKILDLFDRYLIRNEHDFRSELAAYERA
jgi:hypothetical protein